MTFTWICYESILFEPGKYTVNGHFEKFNSFSIILSANVWSGIISIARVVQIVINVKQIRQENDNTKQYIKQYQTIYTKQYIQVITKCWSNSSFLFPAFEVSWNEDQSFSIKTICTYTLCIQSECGKTETRITPNTDTFDAVLVYL